MLRIALIHDSAFEIPTYILPIKYEPNIVNTVYI
jgi:hypothetical protein